jgi:phenylalanyl-tRNA synthetase alpha chain
MSIDLHELERNGMDALAGLENSEELEAWRLAYLGKKGALTLAVRSVGQLPAEERPAFGKLANEIKSRLEAAYEARLEALKQTEMEAALRASALDVTLPGRRPALGRLHPVTQTLRDIYRIFGQMGFQVYRSREVESDEYNFQLLNFPPHHPARDMQDTLYVNEDVLMRTHTSPGQIHAMRNLGPGPIRVILPGKCYREEQVTVRSEFMFYQVEGLAVGKNITMADLKGTMANFARMMFGADRQLRFRCSYFPFTEPSVEVDMDCIMCAGAGCRICKHTGWLEIAGAGMVHPVVLKNGGYDPHEWSGFAFGGGVERMAMLKHGIEDIRYFYSNDLRFLQQFG